MYPIAKFMAVILLQNQGSLQFIMLILNSFFMFITSCKFLFPKYCSSVHALQDPQKIFQSFYALH